MIHTLGRTPPLFDRERKMCHFAQGQYVYLKTFCTGTLYISQNFVIGTHYLSQNIPHRDTLSITKYSTHEHYIYIYIKTFCIGTHNLSQNIVHRDTLPISNHSAQGDYLCISSQDILHREYGHNMYLKTTAAAAT